MATDTPTPPAAKSGTESKSGTAAKKPARPRSRSRSGAARATKAKATTKTESPVAARSELEQQSAGAEVDPKAAEKAAKDQESQQSAELKAGKRQGAKLRDHSAMTIPEQRANQPGTVPIGGRVDNMTRRDDSDVLQGHFCLIDYGSDAGADAGKAVAAQLGEAALHGREPGTGVADYGVYLEPGSIGEDGYPQTAIVMLRDEFAAQVVVPYAALKPAPQGGRR